MKSAQVPQDVYLIAKIFHVFSRQILLQKYFDGNISAIPYTTENLSKESWRSISRKVSLHFWQAKKMLTNKNTKENRQFQARAFEYETEDRIMMTIKWSKQVSMFISMPTLIVSNYQSGIAAI